MAWQIAHDRWGIPHLSADSVTELAFAQGVDAATTRGDQLETMRHRAEGSCASTPRFAGSDAAVAWDRFARRTRLAATGRAAYEGLDPETRAFCDAYADGVNRVLGRSAWQGWTPAAVFAADHILFGSFPGKLWRRVLRSALGPAGERAFGKAGVESGGSNVLGLDGGRTTTGAPLIAGDPHRSFEAPNVYAQVHLRCPGVDVHGFTFPGVPGVQHFAHAGSVAWAITNAVADHQDLIVETLERRGDQVWATGPDGAERCEVITESIMVDGGGTIELEVITTARGPVVIGGPDDAEAVSLRTASWVSGDLGFGALLPLLRSRTVADVEAAFASWVEPVNNLVVADREGGLVHRVVGRVPARPTAPLPVPADDAAAAWTGWVDPLPMIPIRDGAVVSCNDRATDAYDTIGHDFARPFRASRMAEILAGRDRWSADTITEVLTDVRQTSGARLLEAVAELEGLDGPAAALQAELAGWDREMTAGSVTAARFVAVREQLIMGLLAAPELSAVTDPPSYGPVLQPFLDPRAALLRAVDPVLDHGAEIGLDLPALLTAALTTVAVTPDDVAWGERHGYRPARLDAQLGAPGPMPTVTGRPLPGDVDCVAAMGWLPGTTAAHRGPVARYVWDLADRSASRWAVPLGAHESGLHAEDQFTPWLSGTLVPLIDDPSALTVITTSADHPGL